MAGKDAARKKPRRRSTAARKRLPKSETDGETAAVVPIGEALTLMARNARDFRPESVKPADLALVAAAAPEE